jgi:hypothetical protein
MNFREFLLQERNTVGTHNDYATGAYLSSNQSGSELPDMLQGRGMSLPSTDLLPTLSRCSPITFVELKKNPILVMLSDGTRMYFTWDEFRRIPGEEPKAGKTLSVTFQRFPGDDSKEYSQIQTVRCY